MVAREWGLNRIYSSTYQKERGLQNVVKWEVLALPMDCKLRLTCIGLKSDRVRQGVRVAVDCGLGVIKVGDSAAEEQLVWIDDIGYQTDFFVETQMSLVSIFNICWYENHPTRKLWCQGDWMGMVVEDTGQSLIYRCNDCFNSSNFDSLVFSLELLDGYGQSLGSPSPVIEETKSCLTLLNDYTDIN